MIGLRFCDWLKVDLVKRSADGRNFFLPSYARTPKLKKELKWPRLNSIKSRDNKIEGTPILKLAMVNG